MTYRELLQYLTEIPAERLDDNVTLYDSHIDEYLPLKDFDYSLDDSVLDEGHPILVR